MAKEFNMKLEGARELEQAIKRLGKLPQKCVTPAARKGARIALKAAKANAPVDTGTLKQGIIIKGERTTKKGKKVYDIMMDPALSDEFAKEHTAGENAYSVRQGRSKPGTKVRAYYPASMEFGFFAKNGRYIPGYHFLRNSIEDNAGAIEKTVVTELTKNIDKEWNKK